MFDTFRPLTPDDVPVVIEIENDCFSEPWDEGVFIAMAVWKGDIPSRHGRWVRFDVFVRDGEIHGYVVWEKDNRSKEGHILNLAVKCQHRRRGTGLLLMKRAFEDLTKDGFKTCRLEVRESNSGAQRLYEKMGMRACGRTRGYYGDEDALIYSIRF